MNQEKQNQWLMILMILMIWHPGGRVPLDEGGPIQEFGTLEEEFERDFKIYKEGGGKLAKSYYFRMCSRGGIAQGGRVPMWMGGGLGKGQTLLKEMIEYFSKGSKHGENHQTI